MIAGAFLNFAVFPVAAYLVGSIPFGVVIARSRGIDLRARGSGNIGATNVGRVMGPRWGVLCFVLDTLKGFLPVLVVGLHVRASGRSVPAIVDQAAWLAVGFAVIAGHVFSLYLRFRGGKGVATSLGLLLGFFPYFTWAGLAALAVWILTVLIWRYVSLASVAAATAFPLLFVLVCILAGWSVLDIWPLLAFAVVVAALVVVRHRSNIARLLAGTENRIGHARREGP